MAFALERKSGVQRDGQAQRGSCSMACLLGIVCAGTILACAVGYSRTAFCLGIAWLILFWFIGSGLAADFFISNLIVRPIPGPEEPIPGRELVILLGDGTVEDKESGELRPSWLAFSRIVRAVEIYHGAKSRGRVCALVVTGTVTNNRSTNGWIAYQKTLLLLGVAEADLQLERRGLNTFQHAKFASELIRKEEGASTVILVTSALHMKRALRYFARFGVIAKPAPSDTTDAIISVIPSGYNFALLDIAIHQFVGLLRLRVYDAMGWNENAPKV